MKLSRAQKEHLEFIYKMTQGGVEVGGCTHYHNKIVHEALERKGMITFQNKRTQLTPEGRIEAEKLVGSP